MKIIIIILMLLLLGSNLLFLYYRRQVRLLCRHTAFIRTHQTNQILIPQLRFPELMQLAEEVNRLLEMEAKRRLLLRNQDKKLRETLINLSHDIRTPLTSLDGYFQLMLQENTTASQQVHYAEIIQERIADVKGMLEELFDYTKLQNDTYRLQCGPVDMNDVVCRTAVSFFHSFEQKELAVHCDFLEEELPVLANREALIRVFQNIMKNALVHGKSQVNMRLFLEEEQVIFICENDVEAPEQIDISRVFEQFYMADGARSLRGNSTGLGLAIAKGFVTQMQGEITAELEGDRFAIRVAMHRKE